MSDQFYQVEDYVWCDHHGAVHEPDTDPFESDDVCSEDEWLSLWVKRTDLQ